MSRISIAMATCNGERYLEEQLDSLARQSVLPAELQVGDDASTDGTEEIVRRFASSAPFPVTFVRNQAPLGYGENFIRTALRCSGEWIAFCDQDDVWLERKLAWAGERIAKGPTDLTLIAHDATIADDRLGPQGLLYRYPPLGLTPRLGLPPEWHCAGFTQLFRAHLLRDIPADRRVSFPWHSHREAHDVWVSLLANCTGSVVRSSQALVLYRRHDATVTEQGVMALDRSGESYGQRAEYLDNVAVALRRCGKDAAGEMGPMLTDAAERIAGHASLLRARSQTYLGATLPERISALTGLVAQGAYIGRSPWRFGASRLGKDLLGALRLL